MKSKKVKIIVTTILVTLYAANSLDVNWAKAMQLSLYFYDANKCGPGVQGGRLEWRGDCHVSDAKVAMDSELLSLGSDFIARYENVLDPDGDGYLDFSKGFHDAGDHVKFGLPESYSASTLGWGLYEFKEAFVQTGEYDHMIELLKWFSDYFLNCTFIDPDTGEVIAFAYMVGEGTDDHTYWGPPELQDNTKIPRPIEFATADSPASEMAAGAGAALAIMYLNYVEIDPVYAKRCLEASKALYRFAKTYRGLGTGDGFYESGYAEDELAWNAVWLQIATGDMSYIDDIVSVDNSGVYTGYLKKIIATTANTWQNIWVHCWDVVWGGVFVKMAHISEDPQYDYFARWNIEYWSGGVIPHEDPTDTAYLYQTPAGYGMINTWGSARYNSAAQLQALVYHKYKNRPDFAQWAKSQMEYIMGDNPAGRCMEVGYDETSAVHPHHRAAHGSKTNSMVVPQQHRHTLWGALVGGPDGDDVHVDDTVDFVYNEVAIDYNAGFVGALAGHYLLWGQDNVPVDNFPPSEPSFDAFYAEAKLEQENTERSQITINIHNETALPPRFSDSMSARYYFDLAELYARGQSIDDLKIEVYYDEQEANLGTGAVVTGPFPWNFEEGKRIYYFQFDWTGHTIYGDRELQFALTVGQDANWQSNWDPANDWSRQDITGAYQVTPYIPFYEDGTLIYGEEPEAGSIEEPGTGGPGGPGGPGTPAAISVEYRCAEDAEAANQIKPVLNVVHKSGTETITLSDLKIRYYFTNEQEGKTFQADIDYTPLGSENITREFVTVAGNLCYLEIGFTETAGVLTSRTGEIQMRLHAADYSFINQADDYSFDPDLTVFTESDKITLYKDGELIWGVEP